MPTPMSLRYERTGEVRPPRCGEWFWGTRGPTQARFTFSSQDFPILREVLEPNPSPPVADGRDG